MNTFGLAGDTDTVGAVGGALQAANATSARTDSRFMDSPWRGRAQTLTARHSSVNQFTLYRSCSIQTRTTTRACVSTLTPSQVQIVLSVAGNIARLRIAKAWTQEQLAERAHLAPRYLQRIERGSVNLSVVVLVQLARALAVPASRLLRPSSPTPARRGRPPKKNRPVGRGDLPPGQ